MKADALPMDQHESIKITLWETNIEALNEDPFPEDNLFTPQKILKELITTETIVKMAADLDDSEVSCTWTEGKFKDAFTLLYRHFDDVDMI
eukprot:gene1855-2092_t